MASDMEAIEFNIENLINVVHNEPVIWNATLPKKTKKSR